MKTASIILRFCLLLEGFLLILRTPQVIVAALGAAKAFGGVIGTYWISLSEKLEFGLPVLGMCCLMTVWGMVTGRRWAERAALFVSLIHLALLPFGWLVGLAGLWFWKQRRSDGAAAQLNVRWQEAVPTSMLPAAFRLLAALSIAGLAGMVFLLIRHSQTVSGDALLPAPALAAILFLSYIALSVLHDVAHWVAGVISGFQYHSIPIGPVQLVRRCQGGWTLRKREFGVWRHLRVDAWPTRPDRTESRLFARHLGGPLSDFVAGLVTFVAAATLPFPHLLETLGLTSMAAFGRFLFDVSLSRTSSEDFTPGARLVQLWNRTAEGERWSALHLIGRSQRTPVRPADWPEAWAIRLTSDRESPCYPAGCFYAYAHYMDAGNVAKAGEYIEMLRGIAGWDRQPRVAVEMTFYENFTGRDRSGVIDYGGFPASERGAAVMRMEAMALLSDGYTMDAVALLEKSRKRLEAQQEPAGWALFENTLLQRIEQKILDQRAPAKAPQEEEAEPASKALQFGQMIRRTAM